jgi:hypothetical protein
MGYNFRQWGYGRNEPLPLAEVGGIVTTPQAPSVSSVAESQSIGDTVSDSVLAVTSEVEEPIVDGVDVVEEVVDSLDAVASVDSIVNDGSEQRRFSRNPISVIEFLRRLIHRNK